MKTDKNVPLIRTGKNVLLMQSWKNVPLMKTGKNVALIKILNRGHVLKIFSILLKELRLSSMNLKVNVRHQKVLFGMAFVSFLR